MNIKKWVQRQAAAITLAMTNVEKNALGQQKTELSDNNIGIEKKNEQSTLMQALVRGELTQEVRNLRWRTYKVIKAAEGNEDRLIPKIITNADGEREFVRDEDGSIVFETVTGKSKKRAKTLEGVIVDLTDTAPVQMVVSNEPITHSIADTLEDGSYDSYLAKNLQEKPIKIQRSFIPKFEIENYAKKMVVRHTTEGQSLLEFYVSKYHDEFNMTSKLFISEIKKVIENGPDKINFLELEEIGFITDNTIGANDFLAYTYTNISFYKIIEFNGYYVIKFKANVDINGHDLFIKFIEDDLELKYQNVEQRKITL